MSGIACRMRGNSSTTKSGSLSLQQARRKVLENGRGRFWERRGRAGPVELDVMTK
jgi:hypothetical protein